MRWTPSWRKVADAAAFLYVLAVAVLSTRYLTPLIDPLHCVATMDIDYFRIE